MRFKTQTVIEFENFQEAKAFKKWSKNHIGKHADEHITVFCADHVVSRTTHGGKMLRQYASIVQAQEELNNG